MQGSKGRELKTLTTAFKILEHIKDNEDVRLADITSQFSMAKSTAHGYLSTLEELGMVHEERDGYHLGLRALNFGVEAKSRNKLFRLAKPKVEEIASFLNEGVDFMVEESGRLITLFNNVDNIEDPNFRIGRYFYMHNSAGGKAVLAELPDDEIQRILDKWGMPKETQNTITSQKELFSETEKVRQQGYATTDEELTKGLRSVGTTVQYPDGRIFGALGVGGPTYRIDYERMHNEIPEVLLEKANELEQVVESRLKNKND